LGFGTVQCSERWRGLVVQASVSGSQASPRQSSSPPSSEQECAEASEASEASDSTTNSSWDGTSGRTLPPTPRAASDAPADTSDALSDARPLAGAASQLLGG